MNRRQILYSLRDCSRRLERVRVNHRDRGELIAVIGSIDELVKAVQALKLSKSRPRPSLQSLILNAAPSQEQPATATQIITNINHDGFSISSARACISALIRQGKLTRIRKFGELDLIYRPDTENPQTNGMD